MSIEQDLQAKLNSNQRTIFITEADDLLAAWRYKKNHKSRSCQSLSVIPDKYRLTEPPTLKQSYNTTLNITNEDLDLLGSTRFIRKNISTHVSPALDSYTVARVVKDLKLNCKAIQKTINGRQYIALTGFPGKRNLLPGTLYGVKNRKILSLGIGKLGVANKVVRGGLLTIVLTVPFTIMEVFTRDHATCYDLFGEVAADIIKIGTASFVGWLAGLAAGFYVGFAAAPLAFAVVASVIIGKALEHIDNKYQLTAQLSQILEEIVNDFKKIENKATSYDAKTRYYQGMGNALVRQTGYRGPWF